VIEDHPALPKGQDLPPSTQKPSAANGGFGFIYFAAVLSTIGIGIVVGMYFDNTMVSAFVAHLLAGIAIVLLNKISEKMALNQRTNRFQ
jgi:hypothetical protein